MEKKKSNFRIVSKNRCVRSPGTDEPGNQLRNGSEIHLLFANFFGGKIIIIPVLEDPLT